MNCAAMGAVVPAASTIAATHSRQNHAHIQFIIASNIGVDRCTSVQPCVLHVRFVSLSRVLLRYDDALLLHNSWEASLETIELQNYRWKFENGWWLQRKRCTYTHARIMYGWAHKWQQLNTQKWHNCSDVQTRYGTKWMIRIALIFEALTNSEDVGLYTLCSTYYALCSLYCVLCTVHTTVRAMIFLLTSELSLDRNFHIFFFLYLLQMALYYIYVY